MTDEFNRLLAAFKKGDTEAADHLWNSVYRELKQFARSHQRRPDQTLSATALVNETFLKLFGKPGEMDINDRNHFMALCCRAMRMVVVEHIREKNAAKRGDGLAAVTIEDDDLSTENSPVDVIGLDRALNELRNINQRLVSLVELKVFGGFTTEEAAGFLDVSTRTAERDWLKAKMLLYDSIKGQDGS